MPTAFGGGTGRCSAAVASKGRAQAVPPTTPSLSRSRRLSDMSRSRSVVLVARPARQFLVGHRAHLLGCRGRIFFDRLLAALEALRRGPRRADAGAHKQSGDARRDAGGTPLGSGNRGIGVRWRVVVYGRAIENRYLKCHALFGAAHARRANADRPDVGHLVELPDRATGVSVGPFAAQLVQTPSLAVAFIAEYLCEAS